MYIKLSNVLFVCNVLCISIFYCSPFKAVITVNSQNRIGQVNRHVLGYNLDCTADTSNKKGQKLQLDKIRTGSGIWSPEDATGDSLTTPFLKALKPANLRYPGGWVTAGYNWKKYIGMPGERGDILFGLNEFLLYAKLINAEPLFSISCYTGTADYNAEMIEYCNALADGKSRLAELRKAHGFSAPHDLIWLEIGNETYSGNHYVTMPHRKLTAEEYIDYARSLIIACKKRDPNIKLGIITRHFREADCDWNIKVLAGLGALTDFVTIHYYPLNNCEKLPEEQIMRACMAAGEQWEQKIIELRDLIDKYTDRKLPIAVTEYNVHFSKPGPDNKPYRFSLGAALFCADFVRIMEKKELRILLAQYYTLAGGWWGAVQKKGDTVQLNPAYYLFRLWAQHTGETLVQCFVASPGIGFEGVQDVFQSSGNSLVVSSLHIADCTKTYMPADDNESGYTAFLNNNGTYIIKINNITKKTYPKICTVKIPEGIHEGADYVIKYQARCVLETESDDAEIAIGVNDARGWDKTHSAIIMSEQLFKYKEWTSFQERFLTLSDAPGIEVVARIEPGSNPLSGSVEIRNLKIEVWRKTTFPAYRALTGLGSISADNNTLYLTVFNKHHKEAAQVDINTDFLWKNGKAWVVTGSSLGSIDDVSEKSYDMPKVKQPDRFQYTFPPHSMTVIELNK